MSKTERMKVMKSLRFIAPLLAAAFVFSGCNIIKVNPERDGAQVVATVYGEDITKKEVYDLGAMYGYNWTGKIDSWNVQTVQQQKEQMLESVIQQKVMQHVAKDKGFYNFSDDEQKQIDDYVMTITQDTYDAALAKYQEEAKNDPSINPEEKANADVDAYLSTYGYTRDKLKQEEADSIAQDKLEKSITDTITPTDDDIKKEYDSELAKEQTDYVTDPTQAVSDDNGSGTVALAFPADGYIRVRHILIPLPDDIQSQIATDRSDGNAAEADKLRDDELAKIKATADDALVKAKAAGGDLAKLDQLIVDTGNNDPGMDSKPEGYLVVSGTDYYATEFTDAALKLTDVGVPSELVASDFGYHIIWITQKIAKGTTVPLDQVKDKLSDIVKATQQDTAWSNAITGWMSDASGQIQRFTGRLNN
jgi:hypothetical protein